MMFFSRDRRANGSGAIQQLLSPLFRPVESTPRQLINYTFDKGDAFQIYLVRSGRLYEHVDLTDYPIARARSVVFAKWIRPVLAELDERRFCVHLGDNPCDQLAEGIPNLCYCKKTGEQRDLRLIPDAYYQGQKGYTRRREYRKLYGIRWEDKRAGLVFRGAYTGEKPLERNMRARLCALESPLIDARLTGVNNVWEDEEVRHLLGSKMSKCAMARYKYQIDIDGNSSSWDGLFWKMMSGSLTFKLSSEWQQWYYPSLADGVHYVKIDNYADLLDKLSYYEKNEDVARNIADNARNFTRNFHFKDQYAVFFKALA